MRDPALAAFLAALKAAFAEADLSAAARAALARVFDRLDRVDGTGETLVREALPVTALLPEALAPLRRGEAGSALAALADSIAGLAPRLPWVTRKSIGPTASDGFALAHANAQFFGPGALEPREDVMVGISLMAPGTRYPDHTHPPEEVYLVLSEGAFLQGEGDFVARKTGDTLHNTPGIRHAMRAGDRPFLALWCLPV